jgi:poly(3-hydroxybutyrate) depolymerase
VLVRRARSQPSRGVLAGFHGYTENAAIQLARLDEMAGADAWTIVSIQGLHRFYRHRTQDIAASWMTREDRETAIADNIAYVTTALEVAPDEAARRVVYAGFSQGVAMAFRAACRGRAPAAGVMAVGGDVPPELLADAASAFRRCCSRAAALTSGTPQTSTTRICRRCARAAGRSTASSMRGPTSGRPRSPPPRDDGSTI